MKVLLLLFLILHFKELEESPLPEKKFLTKQEYTIDECEKSIDCRYLVQALYHEARGESDKGVIAVAYVILNRANHKNWPSTIKGVITQPWQFSYRMEDNFQKGFTDKKQHRRMAIIAQKVLDGELKNPIGGAVYYHHQRILPRWAKVKRKVAQIGNHVFRQ